MQENKGFDFLDFIIIILKWKKFLLISFLSIAIISYLVIYLTVEEQFESTALIIPSEQNSPLGFSSLVKDLSALPISIGSFNIRNDIDFYTTLTYSRSNLQRVAEEFNLIEEYKVDNMEEAIKVLKKQITAKDTKEDAFQITARANSPEKSAAMTNFIVELLNQTVIEMNVKKSRDNRVFLEKRYEEVKTSLNAAEDSLRLYQQKSGIYMAEEQGRSIIEAYTKLESELATKEIELSVIEQVYGKDSPQASNARIGVEQFSKKVAELKKGSSQNLLLGINSLPEKAMDYIRYYRDVQIFTKMLEYIIPLYEQTRYEEQKNIPILQIIDYAVPPVKRAYPQRVFISLLISLSVFFFILLYIFVREIFNKAENPKLIMIREEAKIQRKKNKPQLVE
jgi:tyrosine-protein kinase Etk/Wzc